MPVSRVIRPPGLAWHASLKLVGWWPTAFSAILIAAGLAVMLPSSQGSGGTAALARVLEVVVPLAFAAQAAFVLAPDGEPPLELLLTCPRPLAWALWERLAVLAGLQGGVALAASLVTVALEPGSVLALAIVRWIAPGALLAAVAVLTTQSSRQGVFGALLATLLWASMLFGGDVLLARWPFLWPLHLFLQPEAASPALYAANRASLVLIGLVLLALAAHLLRNEERVLGLPRSSRGA